MEHHREESYACSAIPSMVPDTEASHPDPLDRAQSNICPQTLRLSCQHGHTSHWRTPL